MTINKIKNSSLSDIKAQVKKACVRKSFLVFGVLLTLLSISSCTHRIVRSGYEQTKTTAVDCHVPIVREQLADTLAEEIGQIKLGESGFSTACSESHALTILKKEACAIGADFVVITEENRPDLWSSCYRCEAKFYRFSQKQYELLLTNELSQTTVKESVEEDKDKNGAVVLGIIGGVVGFVIGYSLFSR